jgi:hypothetical protein
VKLWGGVCRRACAEATSLCFGSLLFFGFGSGEIIAFIAGFIDFVLSIAGFL